MRIPTEVICSGITWASVLSRHIEASGRQPNIEPKKVLGTSSSMNTDDCLAEWCWMYIKYRWYTASISESPNLDVFQRIADLSCERHWYSKLRHLKISKHFESNISAKVPCSTLTSRSGSCVAMFEAWIHLPSFANFANSDVSSSVKQCQAVSSSVKQCQAVSSSVKQCQAVSSSVKYAKRSMEFESPFDQTWLDTARHGYSITGFPTWEFHGRPRNIMEYHWLQARDPETLTRRSLKPSTVSRFISWASTLHT